MQEGHANNGRGKQIAGTRSISWSAIIVGSFVAIGLGFLLNLFGLSIGLSLVKMNNSGALTFAIGGFIALLVGTIVIMFVAGWISGYLGKEHSHNPNVGAIYGFATWCLALIVSIFIAANVTEYLSVHNYAMNNPITATSLEEQAKGLLMSGISPKRNALQKGSETAIPVIQSTTPNLLEEGLFGTFLLFFVGAIASCLGGYSGLNIRSHSEK